MLLLIFEYVANALVFIWYIQNFTQIMTNYYYTYKNKIKINLQIGEGTILHKFGNMNIFTLNASSI